MQFIAALIVIASTTATNLPQAADTILVNGNIYTVNDKQPHAEAVAVKDGRIILVGSNSDVRKLCGSNTAVMDLSGRPVFPGLTDSHCHIFEIGEREMKLNLEGTRSLPEFLKQLEIATRRIEPGKWIVGRGWIETFWTPPEFPTRADLDKIAPENPVFLVRADGHAAAANSAALKISGITRETPDLFGGKILKDNSSGEPTGMLLDNAMDLVSKHIPPPSDEEKQTAFLAGVEREIKLGWCEIQNAGSELSDQAIMRRAFDAGKVKLRLINAAYGPGPAAQQLLQSGPTLDAYDHHFTQRTIKVILDGALGSRGAALLAPYSDRPDTSGYLMQKETELLPMFEAALRRGIQVETHAIGDRANRVILDLYQQAFRNVPPEQRKIRQPRWRVEHAQILSEQDIPRFARLGVIASMQPSHAISDLFFAPARLGFDRLAGAYAWNSLLKTGAVICGGSDAPVERGEPMIEFYAAVSRKSIAGFSGEGWHPEQAVSRAEALKMFTINAAYAAFEEKDKGSIEPGKLADFTVLSEDIMKIPEPEILKTRAVMTCIGGQIVSQQ